jgi:NAD-dependent dihydropyrimidine dehydrogenase PreA subunit
MTTQTKRKIVRIDEEKCDGCGLCIITCAEGALEIIDGKAKLLSDQYCDGLGACLGECPQGAISIEERYAEEFDEELVQRHLGTTSTTLKEPVATCPALSIANFDQTTPSQDRKSLPPKSPRRPNNWPIQIRLVPPEAPFLKGTDLVVAADCAPFIYPAFHEDILGNKVMLIACPKLDDFTANQTRFTEILKASQPRSITVARMEVPCCSGLTQLAREAIRQSGANTSLSELVIKLNGDLKE